MSREDQYNVTASVSYGNQARDLGTFDKMSGGGIDSEESKFYPGGMGQAISLGGRVNVENITLSRLYDLARDHNAGSFLVGGVGKAVVTVVKTSLDIDGNAYGSPFVYRGTLKRYTPPEPDSESSDPALFEVEITSATVSKS